VWGTVIGGALYFLFAAVPIYLTYAATLVDPAMTTVAGPIGHRPRRSWGPGPPQDRLIKRSFVAKNGGQMAAIFCTSGQYHAKIAGRIRSWQASPHVEIFYIF
jgi:hypothetical protein